MGPIAWGVFSLVIIAISVTGAFLYIRSKRNVSNDNSAKVAVSSVVLGTDSASEMLEGENAVVVTDSLSATDSIIVNTVKLSEKGYVTIKEDDNGQPGKVIGRSDLLDGGVQKLIVVALDRATKSGETLYAVLYKDDGNDEYEADKDEQIKNGEKLVAMRFKVL